MSSKPLYLDDTISTESFLNDTKFSCSSFKVSLLEWKRPKSIIKHPQVFGKNLVSEPVQGYLGDCWLVSASSILKNEKLLKFVFGNYTDFDNENYDGKWDIQLFDSNQNKWICVTIDDCLPTINNNLLFGSCKDKSQFWFALLEKACAKFYGCYGALNSGQASEGFMLVTAGFCWKKYLSELTENTQTALIQKQIATFLTFPDIMILIISVDVDASACSSNQSASDSNSIVPLHYYTLVDFNQSTSIITVQTILFENNQIITQTRCLKLKTLQSLRATFTFCSTSLHPVFGISSDLCHRKSIQSAWKAGLTSGGRYELSSYQTNPQFLLQFYKTGLFYIDLIQNNSRDHRKRKESQQAIAIHAWKVPHSVRKPMVEVSLRRNLPDFISEPVYQYKSDVSLFGVVKEEEKNLLVIPSTYSRDINCQFLIRICSTSPCTVKNLYP